MNNKFLIPIIFLLGLGVVGFIVFRVLSKKPEPKPATKTEDVVNTSLPENKEIEVTVVKSKSAADTIILTIKKLNKKYASVAYEIPFETQGTLQGVTSGSKPIDISGKDEFTKDVYLGTCSRNVCRPYPGVTKVSVALELTDTNSQKSQFTKDYPL